MKTKNTRRILVALLILPAFMASITNCSGIPLPTTFYRNGLDCIRIYDGKVFTGTQFKLDTFTYETNFSIYSLAENLSMELLDTIDIGTTFEDIEIIDGYCFLALGSFGGGFGYGFAIIDYTDPNTLDYAYRHDYDSYVYDVEISGNIAWLSMNGHLITLDVTSKNSPVQLHDTSTEARECHILGNQVLLCRVINSIELLNVSVPAAPVLINNITNPYYNPISIEVVGNYAIIPFCSNILGNYSKILKIYDLTIPTSPEIVASINAPGDDWQNFRDLMVFDDLMFYEIQDDNIEIYNISDIQDPQHYGRIDTRSLIKGDDYFLGHYSYFNGSFYVSFTGELTSSWDDIYSTILIHPLADVLVKAAIPGYDVCLIGGLIVTTTFILWKAKRRARIGKST